MTRKLKVAPNRQIVDEDGKHYFGGQSLTVPDDHREVNHWLAAGYVSESGKRTKRPQDAQQEEAQGHFVARARGLVNREHEDEA